MSGMFHFKQFSVDQYGCAMKINTDGVLLGALASADHPESILDIGTGTGVIALMLAQRFTKAKIDAVEIDETAALTAGDNFKSSPFANRLKVYPVSFEIYFEQYPARKYDLIVSNPPFYINSLKSPNTAKTLAKHSEQPFFEQLIVGVINCLTQSGQFWFVLPLKTAELMKKIAAKNSLYLQSTIILHSFNHSKPHREIMKFGFVQKTIEISKFVIYEAVNEYSDKYKLLLKPYFIAF